jgi:hypothetical protein
LAGRASKSQPLVDLALGLGVDDEEERERPDLKLTPRRQEALEAWRANPWAFLTGTDPDTKQPIIRTVDQRDKAHPVKPFPKHLDYLHYLVDLLLNEPHLIGEKSSQMIFSTTVLLFDAWACAFKPGFKVLLSKHSEEEAEILLAEKVRTPWSLMPLWLQRQIPVSKKPKNTAIFAKPDDVESLILGLPENAAAAKARGQTYQAGRIDEAEFQEMLPGLITAMLPRCGQLVLWSTPHRGGAGVAAFRSLLADDPVTVKGHPSLWQIRKKWAHVSGMTVRRNEEKDFTIARVHYSADPSKTKAWAEQAKKPYVSKVDWDREMEISRVANAGKPFYPQFLERPERFMQRCKVIPKGAPIIRGWDFGKGNPACVWGVWSKPSRRFWVLRELLGYDCDSYAFRDLIKYLSGQLSLDSLEQHPRALQILDEIRAAMPNYPPPWFEGKHAFYDFAGHEGVMGTRGLTKDGQAKTAAEILALGDINLYSQYVLQASRADVINGLCRMRDDGWPGLMVDPACPILWEGLTGGIVYAKPTPQNPDPNEPEKHAVYSHLHEALGYALTNVVRLEDADIFKASLGPDGQVILPASPDMQMMSYLTGGL